MISESDNNSVNNDSCLSHSPEDDGRKWLYTDIGNTNNHLSSKVLSA